MLIISVAAFQVLALPDQAQDTAESGLAALLSVSNFWFWRHSGYFAPAAESMPLLHTWSLGVEEQFYLIFPVVLLLLSRIPLPMKWLIVGGTVIAFSVGLWLSFNKPSVAYYLLPSRAWELAIGTVLAVGVIPSLPKGRYRVAHEALTALGVVLIGYSVFWVRSDMAFPGWVALLPCLGSAMVIYAGGNSWVARRILSARPVVFVGLISYSLYLWHWPVLVGLRTWAITPQLTLPAASAGVALALVLATLSWRYVERPFRNRHEMSVRHVIGWTGTGAVLVTLLAVPSILTGGFPDRLSEAAHAALAGANDIDPLRDICKEVPASADCRFGNPNAPITYAVVGDSHAAAFRPAIEASRLMNDRAGTLIWSAACTLLDRSEFASHPRNDECQDFRNQVWGEIERRPELTAIVLGGRWPVYVTGLWNEPDRQSARLYLADSETITASLSENKNVFIRSLTSTLERLTKAGRQVILIGSVPEAGFNVPHVFAQTTHMGQAPPVGISRSEVDVRASAADEVIIQVVNQFEGVYFVPLVDALCGEEWCDVTRDGIPLYSDDDHLSYHGAVLMTRALDQAWP